MTKTPSQQLCKLCEIQPRYFIKTNQGIYHCDNKEKAEKIALKHNSIVLDIYPNFDKPENFIELFNLKIKTHTTSYIISQQRTIKNTQDFLENLILYLKTNTKKAKQIKQTIKQTEWEYQYE